MTEQATLEQLQAQIASLQAQLASKGKKQAAGDVHISDKGLVCMVRGTNPTTGKGQWPVSMYPSDWAIVFEHMEKIQAACATALAQAPKA